jgi:hypothetical protein
MWGVSFAFRFEYGNGSANREWSYANVAYSDDDRALLQEGNEKTVRRRCDEAPPGNIKAILPSGFTVCRIKPKDGGEVEEWGTTYIADLRIYSAPNGHPFIIDCLFGELTSDPYGCRVDYRLKSNLNVFYKIDFRQTSIDEVIGLDAALRRLVMESEVMGYPWPVRGQGSSQAAEPVFLRTSASQRTFPQLLVEAEKPVRSGPRDYYELLPPQGRPLSRVPCQQALSTGPLARGNAGRGRDSRVWRNLRPHNRIQRLQARRHPRIHGPDWSKPESASNPIGRENS